MKTQLDSTPLDWVRTTQQGLPPIISTHWVHISFPISEWMTWDPDTVRGIVAEYVEGIVWDDFNGIIRIQVGVPSLRANTRSLVIFALANGSGWYDLHVDLSAKTLN